MPEDIKSVLLKEKPIQIKRSNVINTILNEISALGFLLPFLSVFLLFYLWPVINGAYISMHSWGVAGKQKFIGLKNYISILTNPDFYRYLWHSVYFVILSVPIIIVVGLILALIVNEKIIFSTAIRSIYFLPYILSVSVVSFIWLRMLDSSRGLLNAILGSIGLPSDINWLTEPHLAWWSVVITTTWWTVGFVMILFLAGLKEIPEELYEASNIDGANSFQKFRHITLPGLSRVIRVQIFFQIIAGLKLFGQVHIMLNGGPGDTTNTMIRYIYVTGFKKDFFGLASAQSVLFCIFMLLIAAAQYKFVNIED